MFPKMSKWSRRSFLSLALALAAGIWFQQTGFRTLVDLHESLGEERALAAEVQQIKAQNAALDADIQSLQKAGWEKLARERLGLAKSGEYVVKIPGKK
jgi:cell division protein FtsB